MLIFIGALLNQVFFTLLAIALIMNLENIRRIKFFYSIKDKVVLLNG